MSESSKKKGIIAAIGGLCTAIAGTTVYQVAVDQLVIRPGQQVLTKFLAGQYEHSLQNGMSMVGSMIQNNPDSIAAAANDLAQANLPPAANIQLQCRPLEGEEACLQRNTAELKARLGWEPRWITPIPPAATKPRKTRKSIWPPENWCMKPISAAWLPMATAKSLTRSPKTMPTLPKSSRKPKTI